MIPNNELKRIVEALEKIAAELERLNECGIVIQMEENSNEN